MARPVAASTFLDFTRSDIGVGTASGTHLGVDYTITASGGFLTNATHGNASGCNPSTFNFNFACNNVNGRYDVGFGVDSRPGDNPNEIDGISGSEFVLVSFVTMMRISGFAGMLAYTGNDATNGERVRLEYSATGEAGSWSHVLGSNGPAVGNNPSFNTVGVSSASGLAINARFLRFKADGVADDTTINVTAAGLDIAPVPLPAALPLLLAGMGVFAWAARRKKRMAA